jgi:hypothetical protein
MALKRQDQISGLPAGLLLRFQGSLPRRSSIPHSRANDPIHATRQYSSGKSSVVADRSASVMIHSLSPTYVR